MWIKVFFGALSVLMLNAVVLNAQLSCPCGCIDPDATCPLDTWVTLLATAAFVFATIRLYRKRAAQQRGSADGYGD